MTKGFVRQEQPVYDVEKIDQLWSQKKGDFIGTNCRINTYTLLKDKIEFPKLRGDEALLFMDLEAIEAGQLLSEQEREEFTALFGRVPTEATKDVKVHAKKMEDYFAHFSFDPTARMVSVVFHDDLDGNHLFIEHVGVMVPRGKGVLFVEKLSFQEPYQALQFDNEETVYDYLLTKYGVDYGQETAKPFIMDNEKVVKMATE